MSTTYFVVSWVDHDRRHPAPKPTTREYGTASSKQAAIRLGRRILVPTARLHRMLGLTADGDAPDGDSGQSGNGDSSTPANPRQERGR